MLTDHLHFDLLSVHIFGIWNGPLACQACQAEVENAVIRSPDT